MKADERDLDTKAIADEYTTSLVSTAALSKKHKLSMLTIAWALGREGVPIRNRGRARGSMLPLPDNEIFDMYVAGKTLDSVGQELGISRESVRKAVMRHRSATARKNRSALDGSQEARP